MDRTKFKLNLKTYIIIYSKYIMDLNIKYRTIEHEEKDKLQTGKSTCKSHIQQEMNIQNI